MTDDFLSDAGISRLNAAHREEPAMSYQPIVVDDPRPRVRRITLNRPEKRNALNNRLRGEIFEVLEAADRDPGISLLLSESAHTAVRVRIMP
jgi:1,4-dihydroxy-2-naphthoyl-CoA synthase